MKRQPGLDVAEKLSIMQKKLNSRTNKMKEIAGEINMYQAKVNFYIFRQTRWSTTSREFRRRFNRSEENTMNRRKENKLMRRMRDYLRWHDYINYIIKCTVISVSKTFRLKANSQSDLPNSIPHLFLSLSREGEVILDQGKTSPRLNWEED